MRKKIQLTALGLLCAGIAQAAVFAWNGSAADGDWNNTANWDGGTAPTILSLVGDRDVITFDGNNMPTLNVPGHASNYNANSAQMYFNSGGIFNLDMTTANDGAFISDDASLSILTVGDGVGGGTDDVVVNVTLGSYLFRHGNQTGDFTVNSDGILNFTGNLNTYQQDTKQARFTINGGVVTATGNVGSGTRDLEAVEFTAADGSFTAAYGGEFANFAAVQADANGLFVASHGGGFEYTDNGGISFTVTAIPEPATLGLVGAFGGCILFIRRIMQI